MTRRSFVAALGVLAAAPAAHATTEPAGLTLVGSRQLSERLTELTFRTPALTSETRVRVLLPRGYAGDAARRYPVLYLLPGGDGGETNAFGNWTDSGEAEKLTADLPLIVVVPEAGLFGMYSDWYNGGRFGPPRWEHYHVNQLIPWVDGHYRTIADRGRRAIAGLSMGGYGALAYAGRHPDLFVAAGSFSGGPNQNQGAALPWDYSQQAYGPYATQQIRLRTRNPWDLASNYRGVDVVLRVGNGMPGGPYPYNPALGAAELAARVGNVDFHERLVALRIPHVWDDYGPGDHSWPYWSRGLRATLPRLMRTFAAPPRPPRRFDFRIADPTFSVWGWTFTADPRRASEFLDITAASRTGITITGSGTESVTTAPYFRPRRLVRINYSTTSRLVRADRAGRIAFTVDLGPANTAQQYTLQRGELALPSAVITAQAGLNPSRSFRSARVRFHPIRRSAPTPRIRKDN